MLAEIKIDYQCKVNRSGYELFTGEDGKPWIRAKKLDAPETVRQFDNETLSRFLKISQDLKNEEAWTLDFVKAYGVLEPNLRSHKLKDISTWSSYLNIKDKQRASGEVKTIDQLNFLNLNKGLSFEFWEDGKVLPTDKPTALGQALYFGWVFGWNTPELRECKYHQRYGVRKGCESFFTPKRDDAEFCSNDGRCRAAYHQKYTKERKL